MTCTELSLLDIIAQHGGVLAHGAHRIDYDRPNCPLCILEAHAACLVARGERETITDDPDELGRPDYRYINDAAWSSREVATPHLVRLHIAYNGWADWSDGRKRDIMSLIAIETVRRIVAELPGLPEAVREQCRKVSTGEEAAAAAEAAEAAKLSSRSAAAAAAAARVAWAAARAARAAARAARAAAEARAAWAAEAAWADSDRVLITAVDIWVEAAKETA